ncbi:MAG TPA: hypothetical protein VNV25_25230 [Gemmatimonadaceae bacterium]|jgi:hypothetical protein|nr:hypothetical protein [Gemmatimonadaceae bacterium]
MNATREQMVTAAGAMLRQYRDEGGNGIDQDDAAGLCEQILAHESAADMAVRAYDTALDGSETFEGDDHLGSALAYLMGAILKGGHVDLFEPYTQDAHMGPLYHLLKIRLPHGDPILAFFRAVTP